MATKSVNLKYFAMFRELAGKETESMDVSAETYRDLYQHLKNLYKFQLPIEMLQLAVNDEFCSLDQEVRAGANIVFIPPVAGG